MENKRSKFKLNLDLDPILASVYEEIKALDEVSNATMGKRVKSGLKHLSF
jgi:hypothetical protein